MNDIFEPKQSWFCSMFNHKWTLAGSSSSHYIQGTLTHEKTYVCERGCSVSLKILNRAEKPKKWITYDDELKRLMYRRKEAEKSD